jgi:hypothetical protein
MNLVFSRNETLHALIATSQPRKIKSIHRQLESLKPCSLYEVFLTCDNQCARLGSHFFIYLGNVIAQSLIEAID